MLAQPIVVAASVTAILYLKLLITQIIQGSMKKKAGLKGPEDGGKGFSSVASAAPERLNDDGSCNHEAYEAAQRWGRILGNDLENIPIGLIVMWAAASIITTKPYEQPFLGYAIAFCVARILHTLAYAFGQQPFRTIAFLIGVIAVIGMLVLTIQVAFAAA